jgi:hypothetical protein
MKRRLAPIFAIAVMVGAGGCGSNPAPASPTTTSSVLSPAGNWSGSISDPISGEGTASLSLGEQAPNALTGTWSATFKNGDSFSGPAVAQLLAPGYGIFLYVQPPPPCATGQGAGGPTTVVNFGLINVVITSTQLTAISGRLSCSGVSFGTINLSRQ